MLRSFLAALVAVLAAGCSPTFNWRQVRAEGTPLQAMLPCKPDQGERTVALAGREVRLRVLGCDTGGATFALLYADIAEPAQAAAALDHWRQASQATLGATESRGTPFAPPGALAFPQSQRVSAQGKRADGSPVRSEAAYFARGSLVVQAVVYASDPRPEWLAPFFEGLRFE